MLNNIGRYYFVNSKIHHMNSFSKIICTLLFIIMTFFTYDIFLNSLIFILLLLIILSSNVPLNLYIKTILSIKWFLLFIIIINLLTKAELIFTIITSLRLIFVILYTSVLTFTTTPKEITSGLELLFSPLKIIKVPVSKMANTISLALRFIPNIVDEAKKIMKSQASRGMDHHQGNLKLKIKALTTLIIPLFTLTIKKSDDLADIMEIRLYNIDKPRKSFRYKKWKFYDVFLVLIHASLLILIVKEVIL